MTPEEVTQLVESPSFRRVLREIVLEVLVLREANDSLGAVRAFLGECEAKGVRVWLREDGSVGCDGWEKLGPSLRAVEIIHRQAIAAHLRQREILSEAARHGLTNGRHP